MGCAPSSSSRGSVDKSRSHRNSDSELDEASRRALLSPPEILVDIGHGIAKNPDFMHTIIFVFGGPGSQKGVLTQELVHEFDFVLINVEDIVFSYLPSKVANTVKNTVEIQELIRRDGNVISIDWILSMVSAKLSTSTSQRFVIDIVPELTSMLRAEGFRSGSRASKMENFERRHEVLFALELHIAEERLLLEKKSDADSDNKIDTKDLSPELSAFIKGIDEADKGRLEKRLEAYHQCAEPFLNYFQKTKRVVKMDLQVPHNPDLQPTIRQLFTNFGFARNNDCIRVVLFVTKPANSSSSQVHIPLSPAERKYTRGFELSQQHGLP
ncbi:Protein F38E11.6 a, partial [Aphelenchoides avenae]